MSENNGLLTFPIYLPERGGYTNVQSLLQVIATYFEQSEQVAELIIPLLALTDEGKVILKISEIRTPSLLGVYKNFKDKYKNLNPGRKLQITLLQRYIEGEPRTATVRIRTKNKREFFV
jgi:hypothetical protein